MRKRRLASAAAVLALLSLSGCGGGGTAPNGCSGTTGATCVAPEFLYATAQNQILGFTVNPATGVLSAPTTTPGPAGSLGIPSLGIVSLSTLGFVYVTDPQKSQIDGFAVNNSTGALSPLPGSPFPLPSPFGLPGLGEGMVADSQGKFLYVANVGINAFSINAATGALTSIASPPITSGSGLEVTIDPFGKFLYSADGSQISAFTIDSNTGVLTAVAGSPFALPVTGVDATDLTVDSTGHFVYVIANSVPIGGSNNYVLGFSIDTASGGLTPIAGSPSFPTLLSPLAIASSGSFLFARSSQGIAVFSIAPNTGMLTEVAGSPFPAGSAFDGMAASADGKFLYEAGPNGIGVFAINPATGAVSSIGNPVSAPGRPLALTIYRP